LNFFGSKRQNSGEYVPFESKYGRIIQNGTIKIKTNKNYGRLGALLSFYVFCDNYHLFFSRHRGRCPQEKKLGGDFCPEFAGGMDVYRLGCGTGLGACLRLRGKREENNTARCHWKPVTAKPKQYLTVKTPRSKAPGCFDLSVKILQSGAPGMNGRESNFMAERIIWRAI